MNTPDINRNKKLTMIKAVPMLILVRRTVSLIRNVVSGLFWNAGRLLWNSTAEVKYSFETTLLKSFNIESLWSEKWTKKQNNVKNRINMYGSIPLFISSNFYTVAFSGSLL